MALKSCIFALMVMVFLILIVLILFNGIFSMSEIAVLSARKFKLDNAVRRGSKGAQKALELAEAPSKFLSTVQIGITLIGILIGLYSGEHLADPLKLLLEKVLFLQPYAQTLATTVVVLATTYISILLGELLPKRIGLSYPESVAVVIALPMHWLSKLTAPFVWLLTRSNDLLLGLFGINATTDDIVTEEEIRSMLSESAGSGQIQEIEQDIVERVFALGDRKVGSLMTHRSDLVWLDADDDAAAIRGKMGNEIHGAYPVCDGEIDNILGLILLKDLFHTINSPNLNLREMLIQPTLTPQGMPAYKLLENFRERRFHYAIVVDEFGSVQGMITMDDILDALVGDVSDAGQLEYGMQQENENTWVVDGQYPIYEFLRTLNLEEEEFIDEDFSTLAGFLIEQMGRIPVAGDHLDWRHLHFEVLSMAGRRVEKVKVTLKEK